MGEMLADPWMVILAERRVTKIEMSESLPFRYCSFRLFNGCVKTRNSRNRPRATSHAQQRREKSEEENSVEGGRGGRKDFYPDATRHWKILFVICSRMFLELRLSCERKI